MNYEKLSGSIRAVIDRRPGDNGAYSDLFSLCREWENEDFSAARRSMNNGGGVFSLKPLTILTPS